MLKRQYYYLDDATKFLTELTGYSFSQADLIDQAIQAKLFMHISASNWIVKYGKKEPFRFDGYCEFDRRTLKSAIQTFKRGEKIFVEFVSVKRTELILYSVPDDNADFVVLENATDTSCPLTITDVVVSHDMLLQFVELHCPPKPPSSIAKTNSTEHSPTQEPPVAMMQPADQASPRNRFEIAGDYWNITFNQKTVAVKNTKGIQYIEYLIRNKGEVHVMKLDYAINPRDVAQINQSSSEMTEDQLAAEGFILGGLDDAFELHDEKMIAALKLRIEQLDEQIEEAEQFGEIEKQVKLETEKDQIVARLSADMGLGGKGRMSNSAAEKARKNIWKRITVDIEKLQITFPEFSDHLQQAIITGTFCQYKPVPELVWENYPKN